MVRKWSYLNSIKIHGLESSYKQDDRMFTLDKGTLLLKRRHVFKVFRSTTRFKRWTVGITRIVRKKYSRRKHLTTFLNLNYLTTCWVSFYLSQRNYIRFYQGLNVLNTQYISPNSDIVIRQATLHLDSGIPGILVLGVSTKYLEHLNKVQLTKSFLKNSKQFGRSTSANKLLLNRENSDLNFTSSGIIFDNTLEDVQTNLKFGITSNLLNSTYVNPYHTNSLNNFLISCRQVIILLTLFNTKR